MITLHLEDYCQGGCVRFEPKAIRSLNPSSNDMFVLCVHSGECRYMLSYLKKHGVEKNDQVAEN